MPRRTGVLALAMLTATAVTAGCGGPTTGGPLQGRVLSAADLPAGWSAVPANPADAQTGAPCLPSLPTSPKGYTYARAAFVEGTSIPASRGGPGHRTAGSADGAEPRPGPGALPVGHDYHRGHEGHGHHPALAVPTGRQHDRRLRLGLHHRGGPDRAGPSPVQGRELRRLSQLCRPRNARGCDGTGVRRRRGGEGGDGNDRSRHRGLDRVRAGADRADQAWHRGLPRHRERSAPGPDHRVQRNHGKLGPALRRRPGRALSRRDLR